MPASPHQPFIVDAQAAPFGRQPQSLGDPIYVTLDSNGRPSYRTEAWRLTDGGVVVIVSAGGGPSFPNVSPELSAKIVATWRPVAGRSNGFVIIEDWGPDRHGVSPGHRFTTDAGLDEVDLDAFALRGLALPRD